VGIIISKLFGRGSGGPLLIIGPIILAPFLFILPFIFLGGAVVALPSAAASFAWDRLDSLFNDPDWKNAMSRVKAYQIPSDRENLLLYRDLWVDGKKVPSDDNAHWMNYGQMTSTVYKPPTGKHVYTFDIGREATLKETALIMACKACSANIVVIGDNPGDPATGKTLSPDEVGAYFTPTQNWRGVGVSGRQAVVNTVDLAGYGTRYLSLFIENNDLEAYVFQVLAFPPGARSNALWAALGQFDKHYRDIYEARVVQALAAASSSNSSSSEQAGKGNAKPLSLTPGGAGDSYYRPLVDGVKTSRLPIYPVVGNNSSPGQAVAGAGLGTSQDKAQGYRPVAMRWELNSYTRGKINQLGVTWLDKFVNPAPAPASAPSPGLTSTSGAGGTLTPGAITTPGQAVVAPVSSVVLSPPVARRWKAYLLSSSENAALLEAIFSTGTGDVSQLPASSLIKDFDNPSILSVNLSPSSPVTEPTNSNPNSSTSTPSSAATASPSPSTTSPAPVSSDKRDTLVVVFEDSSLSLTNLNPLPGLVGDQVAGLPLEWLSPAELYVYEQPPPAPTRPPRSALGSSSGGSYGRGGSGKGGKYDLANGSVSAEKLEAYFVKFPYTGIAGGNSLGQSSPLRPPASGGSGTDNLLKGKGAFYIEMGKKYGINPAYAVAWARKETSMGTTGYAVYDSSNGVWGYNLYNISTHANGISDGIWQNGKCIPPRGGPSDRFCNYGSFEDSIEEYFILLKAYYDGKILTTPGILPDQLPCPCTTPDKILYWYAPSSENDTALYIQQIKNWVDEMGATEVGSSGSNGYNGGSGGPGGGVGNVPAINQYDVSQYDPPYTDYDTRNSTCGTASSTMMINWISGANLRVVDVLRVQVAHPGSWVGATANFDFLNDLGGQYGFVWGKLTFSNAEEYVNKVRELTTQGQPVIVNVVGAPYYSGHFMVAVAYDDQSSTFTINDPAAVQQSGSGPGVVQKWPASKLQQYLQGRIGPYFPAIVISKAGGGGGGSSNNPSPAPAVGPQQPG